MYSSEFSKSQVCQKHPMLRLYIYYSLACIYTGVHLSVTIKVGMSSPGDQTGGGDYTPMQSSKGYRSLMSSMSPGWLRAGSMQWLLAETQEVTVICLTYWKKSTCKSIELFFLHSVCRKGHKTTPVHQGHRPSIFTATRQTSIKMIYRDKELVFRQYMEGGGKKSLIRLSLFEVMAL